MRVEEGFPTFIQVHFTPPRFCFVNVYTMQFHAIWEPMAAGHPMAVVLTVGRKQTCICCFQTESSVIRWKIERIASETAGYFPNPCDRETISA